MAMATTVMAIIGDGYIAKRMVVVHVQLTVPHTRS